VVILLHEQILLPHHSTRVLFRYFLQQQSQYARSLNPNSWGWRFCDKLAKCDHRFGSSGLNLVYEGLLLGASWRPQGHDSKWPHPHEVKSFAWLPPMRVHALRGVGHERRGPRGAFVYTLSITIRQVLISILQMFGASSGSRDKGLKELEERRRRADEHTKVSAEPTTRGWSPLARPEGSCVM
jgi:hypothetical protein